jgi:hypothetical protein
MKIQGTSSPQGITPAYSISNEMVTIAKMALEKKPRVPQASLEKVTSELQTESKKASNAQLKGVSDKIPPNENGILIGVLTASEKAHENVAKTVAGSDQGVFDEGHVVNLQEPDKLSDVFKQRFQR